MYKSIMYLRDTNFIYSLLFRKHNGLVSRSISFKINIVFFIIMCCCCTIILDFLCMIPKCVIILLFVILILLLWQTKALC